MNILVKKISFLSLLLISCNNYTPNYKRIQGDALGTTYQVMVQSELSSIKIKQSIDSIFEVVNNSMSTYRSNSIISKVNQSQNPVKVDSHFIEVFKKSKDIWKLSNGYFDPTAGSIVNLYGMGPNDKIQSIRGLNITITTSAQNDTEAYELLKLFGLPLRDKPNKQNIDEAA